jgi:peptidyl-prolyl cis-trans isomerase C
MYAKTLVLIALLLAAAAPAAIADEINPVLGKVGDFTIRETDLDRLIASQPLQAQKQLQESPELRTALIRDILLKKAIATQARKEGFDRKPEFREQLSYLVDDYLSTEYVAKVILADIRVNEEEIRKYFKEHEKEFLVAETVKARHIYIQSPAKATAPEKAQALAKAEAVLARLKKGEDFAKVAAEVSEDADSAKSGGELGIITPGKTNSTEFEQAVFALKSGETSAVVETPFGFHIIKVDEKTDKRTATFDESRNYIESLLKKEFARKKGEEFIARIMKESGLMVAEGNAAGTVAEQGKSLKNN